MENVRKKNQTLERTIAKAYIFLLPIRMIAPLTFLRSYIGSCASSFDLILHILGVVLYLFNNNGKIHYFKQDKSIDLLKYFIGIVLFFNVSSLIMSIFIQARFGSIGGETAFEATFIMGVYFVQFACIMLYNKHVFSLLSKEEILKVLYVLSNCLLILGYMQILVLELEGVARTVYLKIDILKIITPANPNMPKLWLTETEGAHAGQVIAVFIFPLLLSKFCIRKATLTDGLVLFLWFPIVYYTHSAMAWILIVSAIGVYGFIYISTIQNQGILVTIFIYFFIIIIGMVFMTIILSFLPPDISDEIRYLLFEKAFSKKDGSTATRVAQFYINWGAFSEYPIFGVGNGNQGYFYKAYFPKWALNVPGTDAGIAFNRAQNQIANGSSFSLSLMSGYGIVGLFLFMIFIARTIKYTRRYQKEMGQFYYLMMISWCTIFIASFQSPFVGDYLIWFLLSLPLLVTGSAESTEKHV